MSFLFRFQPKLAYHFVFFWNLASVNWCLKLGISMWNRAISVKTTLKNCVETPRLLGFGPERFWITKSSARQSLDGGGCVKTMIISRKEYLRVTSNQENPPKQSCLGAGNLGGPNSWTHHCERWHFHRDPGALLMESIFLIIYPFFPQTVCPLLVPHSFCSYLKFAMSTLLLNITLHTEKCPPKLCP